MYQGYNRVFWGILFITFHINLGPIRILPAFVGYLFISSGINILYENTKIAQFKNSQILAVVLAIKSIIFGIIELVSVDITNYLIINTLNIIAFSTIEMIMFYK